MAWLRKIIASIRDIKTEQLLVEIYFFLAFSCPDSQVARSYRKKRVKWQKLFRNLSCVILCPPSSFFLHCGWWSSGWCHCFLLFRIMEQDFRFCFELIFVSSPRSTWIIWKCFVLPSNQKLVNYGHHRNKTKFSLDVVTGNCV